MGTDKSWKVHSEPTRPKYRRFKYIRCIYMENWNVLEKCTVNCQAQNVADLYMYNKSQNS